MTVKDYASDTGCSIAEILKKCGELGIEANNGDYLLSDEELIALLINSLSMSAQMSKSAITPSLSGRTAVIEPGVLPIISLAS